MAEHSAVNRRVVGSSPTCGAKFLKASFFSSPFLLSEILKSNLKNQIGKIVFDLFYLGEFSEIYCSIFFFSA